MNLSELKIGQNSRILKIGSVGPLKRRLYMPCIITGVAIKQEFGTWKWYWVALLNGFTVAWVFCLIIYRQVR